MILGRHFRALVGATLILASMAAINTRGNAMSASPRMDALIDADAPAPTGDLDGSDSCQSDQPTAVSYLNMDGTTALAQSSNTATVTHFALAPGDDIEQITPPANFTPLTATDAELTLLGLPPHPTDPDALKAWQDMFAGYRGTSAPGMCTTSKTAATETSANWSGVVAYGHSDYRRAYAQYRVPTFAASCIHASDLDLWTGIGSPSGNPKLLQNGWSASQSSLQGMHA
jgi:hypothetical protein